MWNIREKTAKKKFRENWRIVYGACLQSGHQLFVYTQWGQSIFEVLFDFLKNTFQWFHEIFSWSFVGKWLNLIKSWKLKCNFKKTFSPLCYILTWKANILVYVLICCNVFTPLCKVSKRQNHYFNDFFLPFLKTFLFLFFFSNYYSIGGKRLTSCSIILTFFSHFFPDFFSRQIVLW